MRHLGYVLALLIVLAGCSSVDDSVPTLAMLPSLTPTLQPSPDITRGFQGVEPTVTWTPTITDTATATATTVTLTPTVTVTPSATITNTPTATWTPLPTIAPDSRPLLALALTAEAATVLPTDFIVPPHIGVNVTLVPQQVTSTPLPPGVPSPIPPLEAATIPAVPLPTAIVTPNPVTCATMPPGGFGAIYASNSALGSQIGCPITATEQQVPAAWQAFQQGVMIWLNGEVLVLYNSTQFQSYADTYVEGVDPQTSAEAPPAGLYAPVRGFLKVWSNNPGVREGLGWGLNMEQGVTAIVLTFENGRMIWLPGRGDVFVLTSNTTTGTWQSFAGTF